MDNNRPKIHDENTAFASSLAKEFSPVIHDVAGQFFPTKEERQKDREHRDNRLEFERHKFDKSHEFNTSSKNWIIAIFSVLTIGSFLLIGLDKECLGGGILATITGTGLGFLAGKK